MLKMWEKGKMFYLCSKIKQKLTYIAMLLLYVVSRIKGEIKYMYIYGNYVTIPFII